MKKLFTVLAIACLMVTGVRAGNENVEFTNDSDKIFELQITPESNENQIVVVQIPPHGLETRKIPGRKIERITFIEYKNAQDQKANKENKIEVWTKYKANQDSIMNQFDASKNDYVSKYKISRGLTTFGNFAMKPVK